MHRVRGHSKVLNKHKRQFKTIELMIEHVLSVDENILTTLYIKEEILLNEITKPKKQQHIVWRKVQQTELHKFKYVSLLQYSSGLIRNNPSHPLKGFI